MIHIFIAFFIYANTHLIKQKSKRNQTKTLLKLADFFKLIKKYLAFLNSAQKRKMQKSFLIRKYLPTHFFQILPGNRKKKCRKLFSKLNLFSKVCAANPVTYKRQENKVLNQPQPTY